MIRPLTFLLITVTSSLSVAQLPAGKRPAAASQQPPKAAAATPANTTPLQPPAAGETAQAALAQIQENVNKVQTLRAELEMSEKKKAKKGKPPGRNVKVGPMEIARGRGARVALTRKDETKEYIANPSTLWVYEHHEKEAKYIPTSLPYISGFVSSAFSMEILPAMDSESIKLRGTQVVEGEPCWVIEGKSPKKLEMAGVEPTKMRFWVSQRDGIPRKISVPDEDDLVINLRKVQLGAQVDDARFQFSPPAGVESKNIFGF